MTYHYNDYRVAPLSEWLARLTAKGYTVERTYRQELAAESKSSFWIYDHRGLFTGTLIRYGIDHQLSRWACNVW